MTDAPSDAPLLISTRGSQLALWQSRWVQANLDQPAELHILKSKGDRILDVALQGQTDQGFFTKEIELPVIAGEADLAVHSLKDLPTLVPPELALVAVPERQTVEDVLLVHPDAVAEGRLLPVRQGGSVGATSLRRRALLRHFSPDLKPELLRGNVPTRIKRLQAHDFDAILLARAGLRRLEIPIEGFCAFALAPKLWLPAPGQAALGIEARPDSRGAEVASRCLDHPTSHHAVTVERRLMARFEAGCHAPFAAWATFDDAAGLSVRLGCETDAGHWAECRVEGLDPADHDAAVDAGMHALEAAKAAPPPPTPIDSPCQAIASF